MLRNDSTANNTFYFPTFPDDSFTPDTVEAQRLVLGKIEGNRHLLTVYKPKNGESCVANHATMTRDVTSVTVTVTAIVNNDERRNFNHRHRHRQ